MQAHEWGVDRRRIAQHKDNRLLRFVMHAVGDDAADAVLGWQARFGFAVDELLAHAAVGDEFFDRDDRQIVFAGECGEFIAVGTVPFGVQHFAQDAGGVEAGHAGEIDGRFGMASAAEDAPFFGDQREHVAGAVKIAGDGFGVGECADGGRPFGGGDAGFCAAVVNGNGVRRAEGRSVRPGVHLWRQFQSLADVGENRAQSWPRPWVIMKFTSSGVAFSAAAMKSPSFSRSSASTTMTTRPWRMAATASSMGEKWDMGEVSSDS